MAFLINKYRQHIKTNYTKYLFKLPLLLYLFLSLPIFNFNYQQNGATFGQIHKTIEHEKIIYTIGLLDTTVYNTQLLSIFTELGPYLINVNEKRILFHCYAGI